MTSIVLNAVEPTTPSDPGVAADDMAAMAGNITPTASAVPTMPSFSALTTLGMPAWAQSAQPATTISSMS